MELKRRKLPSFKLCSYKFHKYVWNKINVKKICKSVEEEFVELMKTAEQRNGIELVVQGNSLKLKSEEKLKAIQTLGNVIVALLEKRFKLK